jgi:hypothetical protein
VDTLENYVGEFDQARYMASMLNPLLDEMFFCYTIYIWIEVGNSRCGSYAST